MPENNLVTFNCILVNAVSASSGIFVGTNSQEYWNSNTNSKCGFGAVVGEHNIVSRAINHFLDNDIIDTPIINTIEGKPQKDEPKSEPKDEAKRKIGKETIIKLGRKRKE